jgi:hypothetical protein
MNTYTVFRHGRRIEVETINGRIAPPKRKNHQPAFVKYPARWRTALRGASGLTFQLAVELLFLQFKNRKQPVRLSNQILARLGLKSRTVKWRAMVDLEARQVIRIDRQRGKSPLITVLD